MLKDLKKIFRFKSIFLLIIIFSVFSQTQTAFAVGEICSTNASCCTAPQIILDGGGCPSGTYWIGSESTGSCQSSALTCATSFNCSTGTCTTASSGSACPSGTINIGGGKCADWIKIIRENTTDTIYKLWLNDELGSNVAYLPKGASCTAGQNLVWDGTKWICTLEGLWKLVGGTGPDIYYNAGNVGIGTPAPGAKLHVAGNAYLTGQTAFGGTNLAFGGSEAISVQGAGAGIDFESRDGTPRFALLNLTNYLRFWSNGLDRMVINTNGNVGIGTNTPVNKLDVEGGAAIGATYSGTSVAPANSLIVEGSVGIKTPSPDASSALDVIGKTRTTNLAITAVPSCILPLNGLKTDASGNVSCGAVSDSDWQLDGFGNMFSLVAGNVGIGTGPSPTNKLTVVGAGKFDFGATGSITAGTPLGSGPGFVGVAPNGNRRDIIFSNYGLNLTANNASSGAPIYRGITIEEATGDVGIGTQFPNARLDVTADASGDRGFIGGTTTINGSSSNVGVYGYGSTFGIAGESGVTAVYGKGTNIGVHGYSPAGAGVYGQSDSFYGVSGTGSKGVYGLSFSSTGVEGNGAIWGVVGKGQIVGVHGESTVWGTGVYGTGQNYGVDAVSSNIGAYGHGGSTGVKGSGSYKGGDFDGTTYGAYGTSTNGSGIYGNTTNGYGVEGYSGYNVGVFGNGYTGVKATGNIKGLDAQGGTYGVYATSSTTGIYAQGGGWAGYFQGPVNVNGTILTNSTMNINKYNTALQVAGYEAIWFDGSAFSWGYGGTSNVFWDKIITYSDLQAESNSWGSTTSVCGYASDAYKGCPDGYYMTGLDLSTAYNSYCFGCARL